MGARVPALIAISLLFVFSTSSTSFLTPSTSCWYRSEKLGTRRAASLGDREDSRTNTPSTPWMYKLESTEVKVGRKRIKIKQKKKGRRQKKGENRRGKGKDRRGKEKRWREEGNIPFLSVHCLSVVQA